MTGVCLAADSDLSSWLKTHENIRAIGFADTGHGDAVPIEALATALPDLLKWGMSTMVVESWDASYDCLNQYLNSDPAGNKQLEDFCDPIRHGRKQWSNGEFLWGLYQDDRDRKNQRYQAYHRAYEIIRAWNWNHSKKVVVRPTDDALRDHKVYLDPSYFKWIMPCISPEPGSSQVNLGGKNLGDFLKDIYPYLLEGNANSDYAKSNPYLNYTYLHATMAFRCSADKFNFDRFSFYHDPSEKVVILYGAAHQFNYNMPAQYQDAPVRCILKILKDAYGSDKVLSLVPVGPNAQGTFNSKFQEYLAQLPNGVYPSNSMAPRPLSDYFIESPLVWKYFELSPEDFAKLSSKPDAFDYYWVDPSLTNSEKK